MLITSLQIKDLRAVEAMSLDPSPGLNFVVGDNGAGKTSVLEAIYLGGRGRSFRHQESGPMIRKGAESTQVVLKLLNENDSESSVLGIERLKSSLRVRLNAEEVRRRSVMAVALPVQWVGSQPQLFLELGPDVRRRFIDMGMFHVEHSYLNLISEHGRVLRQRNAALRGGRADEVRVWNSSFTELSEQITKKRLHFLSLLMPRVDHLLRSWNLDFELSYRYRRGWSEGTDLIDQIESHLESDLSRGFTSRGPQRAEVALTSEKSPVEKHLSRGQQKMLVLAINIGLLDLHTEFNRNSPVLLIDDLSAELDPTNVAKVLTQLDSRVVQAFITQIETQMRTDVSLVHAKVFHVEHGALK